MGCRQESFAMALKFGSQFLINTFVNGDQENVSLAGLANGLFAGAYEAGVPFGNGDGIKFQVFNADGSKRGAETTLTSSSQGNSLVTRDPDVAAAPDASFFIAGDVGSGGVNGGRHTDIDLNILPNGGIGGTNEVAIAVRSDGVRLAVYQKNSEDPAGSNDPDIGSNVRSPIHPSGLTEGGEIVNSIPSGAQTRPDVAALTGGRFVTVWETGALSSAFRFVDVSYGLDPNFPPPSLTVALMDQVGVDTIIADARRPVVAALPGDRFVVLWYHPLAIDRAQILGRVYDSNGVSLGDFIASDSNVSFQESFANRDIAVAVAPNGHFMVAWTGLPGTINGDTSGTYIDAAVFNSNGIPGTNSFVVTGPTSADPTVTLAKVINESLTTITASDQFDPSVAALADGRFVLGWTDASVSADDTAGLVAVRGQIFDTRTAAVTVNGTSGHDDYIGSDFNDTLNGLGGADNLTGAAGTDTLDGGTGNDTLITGGGSDTVVFSTGYGADVVEDFATTGNGDKIDLRGLTTVHIFADVLARATQVGSDTAIDFGGGDTLTLKSVQKTNLTVDNFLLSNGAPVIASNGGGTTATTPVAENSTAVTSVTATDPDLGTTLVYSITGGADAAKFQIGTATGALAFIAAPDFEAPADADANNNYVVEVSVTDGGLSDTQTITVSVTDVNEQPGPNPGPTPNPGGALFDVPFYLSHNPDVAAAGVDPLFHYNTAGFHEGRDPNAFFDTSFYLAVNHDVLVSGANPLDHFHQIGWKEGRDPSPNFDTTLYLLNNPDVAAAQIDPLEHFLVNGQFEGRQAFAAIGTAVNGFDAEFYILQNPDVAAAGVDPLAHFNTNGFLEGRNPNAHFDTAGYLSHYTDVAAAGINPLQHYETVGWTEGRDPSATFDTLGYLAANPDVAAAGINPLDHFLNFGIYEGRTAINDGLFH
jgi:hypothetical protein